LRVDGKIASGVFILALIAAVQGLTLLLPILWVAPYLRFFRPVLYIGLAVLFAYIYGDGSRRGGKAGISALLSGMGGLLYLAVLLFAGLVYGFARNRSASGFLSFVNNIWMYGTFAAAAELLRYALIRRIRLKHRGAFAVALTVVYAFAQLDTLRSMVYYRAFSPADYFFVELFPALLINAALSYMALEGSRLALVLFRLVYTLPALLLPIIPRVPRLPWAVLSCGAAFAAFVIYYVGMRDSGRQARQREKRYGRHQKQSILTYMLAVCILIAALAFNARVFMYFPAVVLTGSMTGTIDQGSVVLIEKVRTDEVFSAVRIGDVICFRSRNVEIIHRVVEFRQNAAGERLYITKGDANTSRDVAPVEAEQVMGITRGFIPYLGYPVVMVRSLFR
jgi:signal peptidase I